MIYLYSPVDRRGLRALESRYREEGLSVSLGEPVKFMAPEGAGGASLDLEVELPIVNQLPEEPPSITLARHFHRFRLVR